MRAQARPAGAVRGPGRLWRWLGVPAGPGDLLAVASSSVAWSTSAMVGAAVMLGISAAAFPLMRLPVAIGYSFLAGLLQALTLRFVARPRGSGPGAHALSCGAGALAGSILLTIRHLKGDDTSAGWSLFLSFFLTGWLSLVPLLVPATWLGRERCSGGDILSKERALVANSTMLMAIAGIYLLLGAHPRSGAASQPSYALARLFLALSGVSLAWAMARICVKSWWLGRVRRQLVPGWKALVGEAAALPAVLPEKESPSGLPRWDALSEEAIEGLLIFAGDEDLGFRSPPAREAVPVAFLAGEGLPGSWLRFPVEWVSCLVVAVIGSAVVTWFLVNLFSLYFFH